MMTLTEILDLVGSLDDAPGDNTPRERCRKHLDKPVPTVGALRDHIQPPCARKTKTRTKILACCRIL